MKIICEAKPFAQALQFAGRVPDIFTAFGGVAA
jgi:hypothetical protein